MLNNYKVNNNLNFIACNGGIYKTYKESWFITFDLFSEVARRLLSGDTCYFRKGKGYSTNYYDLVDRYNEGEKEIKQVIILQMILSGEKNVIAEIITQEDFDKYCNKAVE